MPGAIVPPSIGYAGRGQGAQTRIAAAFGRRHRHGGQCSLQTRGRHSGLPAPDGGNHPILRHSPGHRRCPAVSSSSMTSPGMFPNRWPQPTARHGPMARPGSWRAARNRPHGKYALTPSIQLRKPCSSILAPLPCGLQAGNGHPAREFPPIRGLAKLEIAVQPLTG